MVNLAVNPDGSHVATPSEPYAFAHGKIDPREAGRRGGIASGVSRRLKPQRAIEQRVLERNNGMAILKVLELRRERERDLEQARLSADREVVALEYEAMDMREELRRLNVQLDEVRAQLETARGDERVLEDLLRAADRAGVLEAVLLRMGFEDVDDVAS